MPKSTLLSMRCFWISIDSIPACDQVTDLNALAELTTLHKTLRAVTKLTLRHDASKVGIAAIGGVEALVKIMKTFPKCQALQVRACVALLNVMCNNTTGKKKAIESGGIEVVLAAINNHLDSAILCRRACKALFSMIRSSKENTCLIISLGGATAFTKVRTKWADDNDIQYWVRQLVTLIASEMNSWT
jgi:hypothetical protein